MNTILNIYTQNEYGSDKFIKMIAFYEPAIVATSSMNYRPKYIAFLFFSFLFGKRSERSVRTGERT